MIKRELPNESQPPFFGRAHRFNNPNFLRNLAGYVYLIAPGDRVLIVFQIAQVCGPPFNANTSY